MNAPSQDTKTMLEALKTAVAKALERKKRLGQYAVVWRDNQAVLVGEDAPQEPAARR